MKLKPIPISATNQGDKKTADVMLYGPIGDMFDGGLDARAFAQQLNDLGEVDEIHVHINSPGGRIADGLAMYNTLVQHPANVKVTVEGVAASSASWVAQAASPGQLAMCEKAIMMIHCAQDLTIGDHREHDKAADVLRKLDATIAGTYAARSGRRPASFLSMMEDETWLSAAEAVENKLADSVLPPTKPENRWDLGMLNRYRRTPADLADRLAGRVASPVTTQTDAAADKKADDDRVAADHQRAVAVRRRLLELDDDAAD